ncbi:class I SAM-dependent methyltransferase [Streptomyces sp. NPDC014894]|uniref:class I SAM-dependent methyltransferase n=1 Tax=unclassified Streptomyces TaxID=2593676 RepID=UPI00370208B7
MSVTKRYAAAWEGFWAEATGVPGEIFWDAEPELTAGLHLALYEPHVDHPGLTLVDLGCGNGTQTWFLADRFPRVLGADLSPAALALARRQVRPRRYGDAPSGTPRFRRLDIVDPAMVAQLREELGDDCNIYVRGVLHHLDPKDRQPFADAVAALVGTRGRAFAVEPAEAAARRLADLARQPSGPPPKLRPLLRHGLVPGAPAECDPPCLFTAAGLSVLASGELPLTTTEYEPDGSRVELPSRWLVVGRDG